MAAALASGGGMLGSLLLAGIGAVHLATLLAGFTGARARLLGGLGVIAVNYGLRRLLFLDPALGGNGMVWMGLILLGDLTLVLLVAMSAARPAGRPCWTVADGAMVALCLGTLAFALGDLRLPAVVRLAHWKEEYLPLLAYVLARLNGPEAAARPAVLAAVAVLGGGVALWQAIGGPLPIDIAWMMSGHSVLTGTGLDAVAGAHGLGNLDGGYLRPYGIFGNGTDFGVFLAFVGLWAIAARLPEGGVSFPRFASAALRPLPMLCLLGALVSVVRFTWAVWALGGLFLALFLARGGMERGLRLWGLGTALAAAAAAFLALAPVLGDSGSLTGRAFVTGTYWDRWQAQDALLERFAERPALLLTGEGFGVNGAAARKFLPDPEVPRIEPHSRVLDLLQDGGVPLLLLVLAPVLLAFRGGARDPVRAAMLAFMAAFLLCAALLGAKSLLLQTLTWGALGIAVTRQTREAPA